MWQTNFWGHILAGMGDLLNFFNGFLPLHLTMGLVEFWVTAVFFASVIVIYVLGTFVHLGAVLLFGGPLVILEGVRMLLASWRWLKTLLPLP